MGALAALPFLATAILAEPAGLIHFSGAVVESSVRTGTQAVPAALYKQISARKGNASPVYLTAPPRVVTLARSRRLCGVPVVVITYL